MGSTTAFQPLQFLFNPWDFVRDLFTISRIGVFVGSASSDCSTNPLSRVGVHLVGPPNVQARTPPTQSRCATFRKG